ncbi:MAG TPA: H-type lectin domain-containing protein [Phormidium sp.]
MAQSNSDDWKTPLGVYERAIREITKSREEIQAQLAKMKLAYDSSQTEVKALKAELETTKNNLANVQKIADEALTSKEVVKELLRLTGERLAIAEKNVDDAHKEIETLKAENKEKSQTLRIEHGVWEGTEKDTPGWSIFKGEGERVFRNYIRFSQGFVAPPNVVAALSYFDIINVANSRLNVKVAEIDNNGFYFELYTYWDSKVWAAGVNWIAYGY